MLRSVRWMLAGLQCGAALFVLFEAAMADRAPRPRDLDASALGRLADDSTRYLDPDTTGAIGRLLARD